MSNSSGTARVTEEKKVDVWMPLWIGAYLADTMKLTTLQHGAYLLLLIAYWRERGPLADDDDELRSITKLERADWKRMRPVLQKFFRVGGGVWWHKRVETEIASAEDRAKKASEKATKAAEARWGKGGTQPAGNVPNMLHALPQDMHDECPPPSPTPLPSGDSEAIASAGAATSPAVDKSTKSEKDRQLWLDAGAWFVSNGLTAGEAKAFINTLAKNYGQVIAKTLREAINTDAPVDPKAFAIGIAKKLDAQRMAPRTVPSDAANRTAAELADRARHPATTPGAEQRAKLDRIRKELTGAIA